MGAGAEVPADQPEYGLYGTADPTANDGFTIVIFSLSSKENAEAEQQKLTRQGYRALVVPIPSTQYGTLYRVSLGQFATLRDAAIASDELKAPYSENFFIKKITN